MVKQNRLIIKFLFITVALFQISASFSSCGFVYKKHVISKYYIIGVVDENYLRLSYSLGAGGYIDKAPGRILEYGYNDTFLVAKTKEHGKTYPSYYIIDMTKDSEIAHEEIFRIGPLTENEFYVTWGFKPKLQMTRVN